MTQKLGGRAIYGWVLNNEGILSLIVPFWVSLRRAASQILTVRVERPHDTEQGFGAGSEGVSCSSSRDLLGAVR